MILRWFVPNFQTNTPNLIWGVAIIYHQVRCMHWGHPGLFHAIMSFLKWYKIVCMGDILNWLIWINFLSILSIYVQFGVYRHHDDVIKWKHFPRNWPFVRGIHRPPVNSPHKGQWRGALMITLICARINGWVNNCEAGDLRRNLAHYDVIVMFSLNCGFNIKSNFFMFVDIDINDVPKLQRKYVKPWIFVLISGQWPLGKYHRPWFNIKMLPYQCRKSQCGDKTILRPSYILWLKKVLAIERRRYICDFFFHSLRHCSARANGVGVFR